MHFFSCECRSLDFALSSPLRNFDESFAIARGVRSLLSSPSPSKHGLLSKGVRLLLCSNINSTVSSFSSVHFIALPLVLSIRILEILSCIFV